MNPKTKLSILATASIISFSFTEMAQAEVGDDLDQEKCYCIARAGHNDCAGPLHSCAGKSTKDFDCSDWKYVAAGSCEEIGGSLVQGKSPVQ
jgi:uncharacterized membrane protein